MKGFLVTTISACLTVIVAAQDLQDCGDAQYYPSQYTCYDGEFLCPILNGEATQRCGDACYSDKMYSCNDGRLELLPKATGGIVVEAGNPTAPFYQMRFEACGKNFLLGPDGPCTYCPTIVPREACPPGEDTIFFPGTSMSVLVPGGQQYFIEPDGALGFSQAHSTFVPPGSLFGVTAYENGAFTYGGAAWKACPKEADSPTWQIYAELPGLTFPEECIAFEAHVSSVSSDSRGAWQYV